MSSPSGTPCTVKCIGGNACVCNVSAKHPHTIHVCSVVGCVCHTAEYHMEKVYDGSGREFYVPQGARLVRKGKGVGA